VRGTGESNMGLSPEKISQFHKDAEASIHYMENHENVAKNKLAILGTAITARSALLGIKKNRNVKAAVLVSAFLDSTGLDLIKKSPDLPILVVASYQDGLAAGQAKKLKDESPNPNSELKVYFNAGEGSQIYYAPTSYEMIREITDWLWEQFNR
jgi:dienelactone hydrolase